MGTAVPVPVRVAVWGEPDALSATLSVAEKLVAEAGVKVTEILHVLLAARLLPQVLAEMAKSAVFVPVRVTLEIVSAAVPVLERMKVSAVEVVFTVWLAKP